MRLEPQRGKIDPAVQVARQTGTRTALRPMTSSHAESPPHAAFRCQKPDRRNAVRGNNDTLARRELWDCVRIRTPKHERHQGMGPASNPRAKGLHGQNLAGEVDRRWASLTPGGRALYQLADRTRI